VQVLEGNIESVIVNWGDTLLFENLQRYTKDKEEDCFKID